MVAYIFNLFFFQKKTRLQGKLSFALKVQQ